MDLREVRASVISIWSNDLSSKLLASYIYAAKTSKQFEYEEFAPQEKWIQEFFQNVACLCRAAQAQIDPGDPGASIAAGSFVVYFAQQLVQFALALAGAMERLTQDNMETALDNIVVDCDAVIQKQQSILKIMLRGHVALRPDFVAYHCVTYYDAKVYLGRRVTLKFLNERVLTMFPDPVRFWCKAHEASRLPLSLFRYVALYGSFEAYRYFFYQMKESERNVELWYAVDALLHSGRMTVSKLLFSLLNLTRGSRAQFIRRYFVSIFKMCYDDVMFRPLSYTYFNFEKYNITQRQTHEVIVHLLSKNDFRALYGTKICVYTQRELLLSLREMQLFFLRFWDIVPLEHKMNTKRILGIKNMIRNFILCRQFKIVAVIFKDDCVENSERLMILNKYFKRGPSSSARQCCAGVAPRPLYD